MDTWTFPKLLPEGQNSQDLAEHGDCPSEGGEGAQKAQAGNGFIPKSPLQMSLEVPKETGGRFCLVTKHGKKNNKKRWNCTNPREFKNTHPLG